MAERVGARVEGVKVAPQPLPPDDGPLVQVELRTLESMETTGSRFEARLAACIRVASAQQQKLLTTLFAGIFLKHRKRADRNLAEAEREGLK